MKRGNGYTILEVLIFLAISGFMLIAAMVAIGGRQQEVQFAQASRDFENKINDLISDVEIGYFERDARFSCESIGSDPEPQISYNPSGSGSVQGETGSCVLVGKVVVMGEESEVITSDEEGKDILRIFDMAGVRLSDTTNNVAAQGIEETKPVPLYHESVPVKTYRLRYGLEVEKVVTILGEDQSTKQIAGGAMAIMNNAEAGLGVDDTTGALEAAGSTSASVVTGVFPGSVSSGLTNFVGSWRYAGDDDTPEFNTIAICVSGPNARGISGSVTNWNHKEVATLLVRQNGSTQLIFDGSEVYCA